MKSTDKPVQLQDGTVSLSVDTSNLNYLLNGQCPLYVLWLSPTNEFRYAWAREEWQRLDTENPGWMDHGTVTLRFRNILTSAALDQIRQRIIREARLERHIHESLARSSLSETVVIGITPNTLERTDPRQIYELIMSSGMTAVSAGYGSKVMEWMALINPDARLQARIQLVAAYAQASLGRYFDAMGNLGAAAIRRADLSPADQQFLDHLRDVCEYHSGRIELTEYLRRETEWSRNQTGVSAAEHRLEVVRQERIRERDMTRRADMLSEIGALNAQIQADAGATAAYKLRARIILMNGEGDDLATHYIEDVVRLQARIAMGYRVGDRARQTAESTNHRWQEWETRAHEIIGEAVKMGHPLLRADALTARLGAYQGLFLFQRMEALGRGQQWQPATNLLYALMGDVEAAVNIYQQAGNLEGETRAKLLLADLFEMAGNEPAAKKLAEGAIVVAQAMGYERLESHAREHIEGRSIFQQFQEKLTERSKEDEDVHLADESDEMLRDMARHTMASLELSSDRLPVLEREYVLPCT